MKPIAPTTPNFITIIITVIIIASCQMFDPYGGEEEIHHQREKYDQQDTRSLSRHRLLQNARVSPLSQSGLGLRQHSEQTSHPRPFDVPVTPMPTNTPTPPSLFPSSDAAPTNALTTSIPPTITPSRLSIRPARPQQFQRIHRLQCRPVLPQQCRQPIHPLQLQPSNPL